MHMNRCSCSIHLYFRTVKCIHPSGGGCRGGHSSLSEEMEKASVSVSCSSRDKVAQTGWLKPIELYPLTVPEARVQGQGVGRVGWC